MPKKIDKEQQTSDWGSVKLSSKQQKYAAMDVLYLHEIKKKLDDMLIRENRLKIAQECFKFIEYRVSLDLQGWSELDIFSH